MRPMASRVPHGFFDGVQNGTQVSCLHALTSSRSDRCTLSPPHRTVHTLVVLAHPFSNAFRPSSTTFTTVPMTQPNSSNAQDGPHFLAVLLLSKFLRYGAEQYVFLRVHFRLLNDFSAAKCCCFDESHTTPFTTPAIVDSFYALSLLPVLSTI